MRTYLTILLVAGMTWLAPLNAAGQSAPDREGRSVSRSADDAPRRSTWVNPRPYPANVWGPRTGVGLGAGLSVHNLGQPGSRGLVTALVGRYQQVGTVAWAPQWTPRTPGLAVLEGRVFHTKRDWFYGIGAVPGDDTRLELHRTQLRGGMRGRFAPFGPAALRIHLQMHVVHDRLYDQRNDDPDAFRRMDTASQVYLQRFGRTRTGETRTRQFTGVRPQAGLALDTRDREQGARRGVLLQWETGRYLDIAGGASFWTHEADGAAHWTLRETHTFDVTASARMARSTTAQPVPPMYLSRLDAFRMPGVARGRFRARDRVRIGARYRLLAGGIENVLAVEPYVGGTAGAVYRNMKDQFALETTTARTPAASATVPLRLSAFVGVRVAPRFRDATWVDVAVGLGPDGLTGVRLAFTPSFGHLRPAHHRDRW